MESPAKEREYAMQRRILLTAMCLLTSGAAADDFKIIKLEQDVRNLERQVQSLTREIADLRSRVARSGEQPSLSRAAGQSQPASFDWLSATNWNRVRPGMSEFEVIGILGPPTSMRPAEAGRVLLYAMEIGSNGFLSGSVTLKDQEVAAVEKPSLK
jgi:hypothetical protein